MSNENPCGFELIRNTKEWRKYKKEHYADSWHEPMLYPFFVRVIPDGEQWYSSESLDVTDIGKMLLTLHETIFPSAARTRAGEEGRS